MKSNIPDPWPGPWTCAKNLDSISPPPSWGIAGKCGKPLATVEGEANARLMASAPDLLAMLKSLLPYVCSCDSRMDGGPEQCGVCAIIEKAVGA